ncbi:MAG TPA: glycosyltransferase family 87 protein, partial [Phycisphaerae bacterium]|nr:glycosyltransferase family 87 protein [Phycisphaerae bacterium]
MSTEMHTSSPPDAPARAASASLTRRRRIARVLLAVILLACCAFDMYRFLDAMHDKDRMPTLKRWLPYAAELGQDDQLYQRHPDYLYPPFFLVLLKPLTFMPPWLAAAVWQLCKYAAVVAIFAISWRLLARAGPLPIWCKVASVVVSVRFVDSDLSHGNVNLFICLGIVLAAWFLASGRPLAAGFLIALVAAVKITPALWAAYLLYKRQWRALAGVALGLILALELVPLTVLPPRLNHRMLTSWYQNVIGAYVAEGKIYSPDMNQSLAAVTNRLLGRTDWAPGEQRTALVNLNDATIKWIQRIVAAVLIGVLGWSCRGGLPRSDPMAFAVEW